LQKIFTKYSSNSPYLSHQEMSARLLRSLDDERRIVKFLLKQCVVSNNSAMLRAGQVGRAYEELKAEHTKLQQALNSERIQNEQTIADLQHRFQAVNGTQQELQKKLYEKDKQIVQFRQLLDGGRSLPPGSSHSNASSRDLHHPHHSQQQQQQRHPMGGSSSAHSLGSGGAPPPMRGFAENKKRQEQAKQANLEQYTRSRTVLGGQSQHSQLSHSHQPQQSYGGGGSHLSVDSHITPIVPPPNSSGLAGGRGGYNSSSNNGRSLTPPGASPRIRNLAPGADSSSGGYNFTSRVTKRPRTNGSGGGGYASSSYTSSRAPSFGGGFGRR